MTHLKKYKVELTLIILALFHFLIHIVTNGNYGIFRDEYYYIECAKNIAWGYVDHPPLSLFILRAWMTIFGDSVGSIRFLPALSGALMIPITALIARELGGKGFAQIISALSISMATGLLGITGFFSMNSFDVLIWALLFFTAIKILKTGDSKKWLGFGVLVGLGLLNKISVLYFGIGFVAALLFSPYRKLFLDKYLWFAGIIAILIFLPHVIWQFINNWPTLEFMSNAKQYKIAQFSFMDFLSAQILEMGPANFVVWITGLLYLLIAKSMREYRLWGIFFVTVFAFLVMQNGKPYYLYPAYFVVFAAGGVAIERFFHNKRFFWLRYLAAYLIVSTGLFAMPIGVPILPVKKAIAFLQKAGITVQNAENSTIGALPQHFADRFGWEEMAMEVSTVFRSLPLKQQKECVVVTDNYGEAGALNYWSKKYPLPKAVSQHNNYYLWGWDKITANSTIIILGQSTEDLEGTFDQVEFIKELNLKYAMPYEANQTIHVCSGLKDPIEEAWVRGKHFI